MLSKGLGFLEGLSYFKHWKTFDSLDNMYKHINFLFKHVQNHIRVVILSAVLASYSHSISSAVVIVHGF